MADYTNAFLEAHKTQLKNEGKISRDVVSRSLADYTPKPAFGNWTKNITIFDVLALGEMLLDSPNNTGYTGTDTKSVIFNKLQLQQPSLSNSTLIFKRPDTATNTFIQKFYRCTISDGAPLAHELCTLQLDLVFNPSAIIRATLTNTLYPDSVVSEVHIVSRPSLTDAAIDACTVAFTDADWCDVLLGRQFAKAITGYESNSGIYGTDGDAFQGQTAIADSLYLFTPENIGIALCNADGSAQATNEALRTCIEEWDAYWSYDVNDDSIWYPLDPSKGVYEYRPIIELTDATTTLPMLQSSLQRIRIALQDSTVKATVRPNGNDDDVVLNTDFMNIIGNPVVHNDGEGNLDFTVKPGRLPILGGLIDRFNAYTVQDNKTVLYTLPAYTDETYYYYVYLIDGNYFIVPIPYTCSSPFGEGHSSHMEDYTDANYAPQGEAMQAILDYWLEARNLYLLDFMSDNAIVELLGTRDDGAPIWIEEHTVRVQHQGPARFNIAEQVNESTPVGQSAAVHVKNSMYEVMEGVKPAALINANEHVSDDVAFQNLINGKPARLR